MFYMFYCNNKVDITLLRSKESKMTSKLEHLQMFFYVLNVLIMLIGVICWKLGCETYSICWACTMRWL